MRDHQHSTRATFGLEGSLTEVETRREASAAHDHETESNHHLASIYDDHESQFAAVVPFVEDGLARGERVLYVADDNTKEDVLEALRGGGVDVDAARESGALSVHTEADTYHRTGEFETGAMLDFWEETLTDAQEVHGYTGVRSAAEMTWALGEDDDLDQLVRYEALLNTIYPDEDYVVLCQYNRDRFSPDVLSDVIRSHPLVVSDGTVCQNFYYHPPDEFFDSNHLQMDVDRTVEGLVSHATTQLELTERDRFQSKLYEITSHPERSFEEKLQALFQLGCDRFDLELGGLARIDPRIDKFEVEYTSDDHEHLESGAQVGLSETYCRVHTEAGTPAGITDPREAGFAGTTAYREFGVRSYLGTRLRVEEGVDRTFFFVSEASRDTEFTRAERRFLKLMGQWIQQELSQRVYERRLEMSNERLEQFAYAASHDLQEPLRMVTNYLKLIESRYANELDTDADEFIEFAVDGADRMRAMIDGLLEYSRVESRGNPIKPIDLGVVVDDVTNDLTFRIEETDADVTVDDLPRVEGDAAQLRQVFQNLLDNAIEYCGESPPRIHVSAERVGGNFCISVSDTGIGIALDDHDRVFDVFQRLHTREEHEGTGIGLALCERIVERHDGDIWVESAPDEGATFSFTLPAADATDS